MHLQEMLVMNVLLSIFVLSYLALTISGTCYRFLSINKLQGTIGPGYAG